MSGDVYVAILGKLDDLVSVYSFLSDGWYSPSANLRDELRVNKYVHGIAGIKYKRFGDHLLNLVFLPCFDKDLNCGVKSYCEKGFAFFYLIVLGEGLSVADFVKEFGLSGEKFGVIIGEEVKDSFNTSGGLTVLVLDDDFSNNLEVVLKSVNGLK